MSNYTKVIFSSILVLFITACKSPESLESSVDSRWKTLISGAYETSYQYNSPASKKIEDLQSFSLRMESAKLRVKWIEGKFIDKECEENVCKVRVELEYQYFFPRRSMGEMKLKTMTTENWIKLQDTWYYVPDYDSQV